MKDKIIKAKMTAIKIAIVLLILLFTKKLTTGFKRIATMVAKIIGIRICWPIKSTYIKPNKAMKSKAALA